MTKRIHNSKTGKYYKLRERSSKKGNKGQIMELSKTGKTVRKNYRSAVKRLAEK